MPTATETTGLVAPDRDRDPLRDAAPRGRLAARPLEADDDGLYVVKFHAAGQGPKALVAELVAGELGRALGLPVPEIVLVELDRDARPGRAGSRRSRTCSSAARGSTSVSTSCRGRCPSIRRRPSVPAANGPTPSWRPRSSGSTRFITNVDRTAKNVNLLVWHRRLWLIDHGAALYIHHTWREPAAHARRPFEQIADHVLLPYAGSIVDADRRLASRVTHDLLARSWPGDPGCLARRRRRPASARRTSATCWPGSTPRDRFVEEAERARTRGVSPFEYALVRVVPRVERGELFNAGDRAPLATAAVPRRAGRARPGRPARAGPRAAIRPRSSSTSRRSPASPPGIRPPGRSRRLEPARTVPLARQPEQHDRPAVGGPHRA